MRKADIINDIVNKTGIPKVDVVMILEAFLVRLKII